MKSTRMVSVLAAKSKSAPVTCHGGETPKAASNSLSVVPDPVPAQVQLTHSKLKRGKKTVGPEQKREAVRYLVEVHTRPLSRSCDCVGLSRAAWYQPPVHRTVRDAEIIAALAEVVEN